MPLRLLIVSFGFYPEPHGVAEVAYHHALGLHERGYQVQVLTRATLLARSPLPFEVIDFEENKAIYQQFLRHWAGDVILFEGWHTWVTDWAFEILPLPKAKTVLISHGTTIHLRYPDAKGWLRWLYHRPRAWWFMRQMRGFDHYVFLSKVADKVRFTDSMIAQREGWENVSYIGNGHFVDLLVAKPVFSQSSSPKVLLCVSNFRKEKGQMELLKWFLRLNRTDIHLRLLGAEQNDFSRKLEQLAGEALGQSVFVEYTGASRQVVAEAYKKAHVFVSATYTEALPLMLLDAMAAGVPFLCRAVGAVTELSGGLTFKNAQQFQTQLLRLLDDAPLRHQLTVAGHTQASTLYHWPYIIAQYDTLLQKLVLT